MPNDRSKQQDSPEKLVKADLASHILLWITMIAAIPGAAWVFQPYIASAEELQALAKKVEIHEVQIKQGQKKTIQAIQQMQIDYYDDQIMSLELKGDQTTQYEKAVLNNLKRKREHLLKKAAGDFGDGGS